METIKSLIQYIDILLTKIIITSYFTGGRVLLGDRLKYEASVNNQYPYFKHGR